jgi:serine/threonine protein kinase
MTPERWQQVKAALVVALELTPANRAAYLDQACAGDPPLREELDRLLRADELAGAAFLARPAMLPDPSERAQEEPDLWIGRRVGAYKIVEAIGVGGMGEVYRAVRDDDQYRGDVAIKFVRADSSVIISRFKTERQILADLDHPNIARLLDAGTTVDGAPYFVMELVDGQPIDEYCAARHLSTRERLNLFLPVCSAVKSAHQRLIVHRDIKPTNILVTADGLPKLLDFGIAKIVQPEGVARDHEPTASAYRFLTPRYASPEQIKDEPITTATDVYSLGVVLYELLTGQSPYRVSTRTPHEIARAICESEPERPSTAVRRGQSVTVPAQRSRPEGTPEKRAKRLVGDVDNIILMALRKEPARRYESVEQFAEDIRRHLANLPVFARRDTVTYRTSRFILRHKGGVAAALAVAATLVAGTALTLREAYIARDQAAKAESRFNDVRKLANTLIFEIHDSIRQLPGTTAASQLVIQRASEYLDGLSHESTRDPSLLRELSAAYARLASVQGDARDANAGDTIKAVQNNRKAAELLETASALQPSSRDLRRELAQRYQSLARGLMDVGDKARSTDYLQRAVQMLESLAASNPEDRKAQLALGDAYADSGLFLGSSENDMARALEYHQKGLAIFQRLAKAAPTNRDPLVHDTSGRDLQTEISFAHKHIGSILAVAGNEQLPAALDHYRAALAIDEAQLQLHPESVRARYNITFTYSDTGFILSKQGHFEAALKYYGQALDIRAALVAADPQDTRAREGLSKTYTYIGAILQQKGDTAASLDSYRQALAIREALVQKQPANEAFRLSVAESQSSIGDLFAEMAFKAQAHRDRELALCRRAHLWLLKAMPVYLQRKAQGKLGLEAADLTESAQNLAQCDRIIAQRDTQLRKD